MSKKLVAYFSASGVTAKKAAQLAAAAQADLVEIKPVQPYTDADLNWRNPLSRCNREMLKKTRPEIDCGALDTAQYGTVFLGFPIWYYSAPLIINSFLDKYDLSGKTVVLFATSGGSQFGKTAEKLSKQYGSVNFVQGMIMNGTVSDEVLRDFAEKY